MMKKLISCVFIFVNLFEKEKRTLIKDQIKLADPEVELS